MNDNSRPLRVARERTSFPCTTFRRSSAAALARFGFALLAISSPFALPAAAQERELHVVGIYAASSESVANHSEGVVSIILNRPGKTITLLLSAYEPTLWQLNVGAGTNVEKVHVTGYYRQRVQGVPPGSEIFSQSYEAGTGYLLVGDRIESRQFLASVPKIEQLTGLEISSFNGNHVSIDPMSFTIDNVQNDPRLHSTFPQPVPLSELPNLEFQMAFEDGEKVMFRDYTLAGPRSASTLMPPGMRVIAEASKRFYFGAESHTVLKFDTINGTVAEIPYPTVAPEGWPTGTAFDSKRGRVVVVSLGSQGFLYYSTPPDTQWRFLSSADHRDYVCIEYHAANDSYYALGSMYETAPVIRHLAADGSHLDGEIRLPLQPHNGYEERGEIVSVGKYLVVLLGPGSHPQPGVFAESRIYLVDPTTGEFWLTYRKVGQPLNRTPFVQIVSPEDGAAFEVGTPVLLRAFAADSDGGIESVEFFANNQSLGNGAVAADGRYELTWNPSTPATYFVTGRATDKEGGFSVSNAVQVTIKGNVPPTIRIRASNSQLTFPPANDVQLVADASDSDGTVTKVEFFIDGNSIGDGLNAGGTAYRRTWTTPGAGIYTLTAKATDDEAATTTSDPVRVVVRANRPPMVRIVSPEDGATLRSGTLVQLAAEAFDFDGEPPRAFDTTEPVAIIQPPLTVEFFVNELSVGLARSFGGILYRLGWEVPSPGVYTIRAKATDRDGATKLSGPVQVTVVDVPIVVTRHLPKAYRPGGKFRVRLTVDPASAVRAYTIEDKPPVGWIVTRVSRGGTYDPVSGIVRFAASEDRRRRVVGYQVEVPSDAAGVQHFIGTASADGMTVPIGGDQTIRSLFQPRKTGIKGIVFRPTTGTPSVNPAMVVPAANVLIWISDDSTRPAFSVRTDHEGRLEVETSPGIYHVNVPALPAVESNLLLNIKLPATQPAALDVRVQENQLTNVTIHLVAATDGGQPRLIYSVEEVTLSPSELAAPFASIRVNAKGTARSSGWINPQLRRRNTISDGIVEFEFVAVLSEGGVLPVLSPISATTLLEISPGFRGVRVVAETNSKQTLLVE